MWSQWILSVFGTWTKTRCLVDGLAIVDVRMFICVCIFTCCRSVCSVLSMRIVLFVFCFV
jgi:hypothetical protein